MTNDFMKALTTNDITKIAAYLKQKGDLQSESDLYYLAIGTQDIQLISDSNFEQRSTELWKKFEELICELVSNKPTNWVVENEPMRNVMNEVISYFASLTLTDVFKTFTLIDRLVDISANTKIESLSEERLIQIMKEANKNA